MIVQDIVMKRIRDMVSVVVSLLFDVDVRSGSLPDVLADSEATAELKKLTGLADEGKFEEAEDRLLGEAQIGNDQILEAGLLYYLYVMGMDPAFVDAHGYSPDRAEKGARCLIDYYGLTDMVNMLVGGTVPETVHVPKTDEPEE